MLNKCRTLRGFRLRFIILTQLVGLRMLLVICSSDTLRKLIFGKCACRRYLLASKLDLFTLCGIVSDERTTK